jgi:hypothetical protein
MLGEVALADARLAVEAVQRGFGSNADEIAVTFFVLRKDQEVVVLVAFSRSAMVILFGDVELTSEDGLDALGFGGVEEVDGPVDVAMVRHCHGLLAERGNTIDELVHVTGTIEK